MAKKERFPGEYDEFPENERNWFDLFVPEGDRKIRIATYRWRTSEPPKAVMLIIHGLNSHAEAMAVIAKLATQQGIECVALDLRNFARSESATQGNFSSVEPLLNDCLSYFNHVYESYPDVPIFVLG
jgi:alpha-beta hydrolase superfamily lysophospholipase